MFEGTLWLETTEHPCPACGHKLMQHQPSTMLVCPNTMCEADPFYLAPKDEGEARG